MAKPPKVRQEPYTPTEREANAMAVRKARRDASVPHPRLKVTNTSTGEDAIQARIEVDHKDPSTGWDVLVASLGVGDPKAGAALIDQITNVSQSTSGVDQDAANGMLALVQEIEPRDAVEAMLATQMASIHAATMKHAAMLNLSLSVPSYHQWRESHNNGLNKLARTFAAQVEALKRYRSKGEQRMVVEHQHVHVHPGAQAVVGDVYRQGAGEVKNEGQPVEREPVCLPQRAPMLREVKADGMPVPSPGGEGLERLPVPRRARGAETG